MESAKSDAYAFSILTLLLALPQSLNGLNKNLADSSKPYTRRRACRNLNHNFQPQRSHLNRSSGFSLEAVLPQRGHFIVHICVKGPSGATSKIWNVDFTATFLQSTAHRHRGAIRFACISDSTTLIEKKTSKVNQLISRGLFECRTNVTISRNFSSDIAHLSYQNQGRSKNSFQAAGGACSDPRRLLLRSGIINISDHVNPCQFFGRNGSKRPF